MKDARTRPRVLRRLLWSHLGIAGVLGGGGALVIFALFALVEDASYRSIVRSTLERGVAVAETARDPRDPLSFVHAPNLPIRLWRLAEAPEDIRALAGELADGLHEDEAEDRERHLGLATDGAGIRWVAVLETSEVETDLRLATALAVGVLVLSVVGLGVGYLVARRTLAPLERLAAQLDPEGEEPRPEDLVREAGDDEVGLLARQLARYLGEREEALARERDFLRDASHELRNPLSVLHGGVELLRETGPGEPADFAERLDRMDRSVARMRRTVEELLQLAREESAAAPAADRPLEESLSELVTDLRAEAGSEVELRLDLRGQPPGSPGLWLVILRNLLDNAVRATSEGRIDVLVDTDRVCVRDTGQGIAPELLERVTEPYVGGTAGSGVGLGLSIVRRLAERLGWEFRVDSSKNGTRVELAPRG